MIPAAVIVPVSADAADAWLLGKIGDGELLRSFELPLQIALPCPTVPRWMIWIASVNGGRRGTLDMLRTCGAWCDRPGFVGFVWRAVHPKVQAWSKRFHGVAAFQEPDGRVRYAATGHQTAFLDACRWAARGLSSAA